MNPDYLNRPALEQGFLKLLHDINAHMANIRQGGTNIRRYIDNEFGDGRVPSATADRIRRAVSNVAASTRAVDSMMNPFLAARAERRHPRFGVKLESFRGLGIGAVHWNARGWYCFPGGEYQEFIVGYNMTEKQAALLSEPDYTYHRGDYCERFFSEDEAVAKGVEDLIHRFGDEITIERGAFHYETNPIAYSGADKAAERLQERLNR